MKIIVINLERAKDRRRQVTENLQNQGVSDFEFFTAVDGAELPDSLASRVDHSLMLERQGRPLTNGEIGCALSHSLVYEKIVREGIQEAIILEDDAVVGKEFCELLESGELGSSGFQMILLHVIHPRVLKWPIKRSSCSGAYYKLVSRTYGATAYYLTYKGALRLLEATQTISRVADWPVPIHFWLDTVCYYPFTVYPKYDQATDSAIEKDRAALVADLEREESHKPRGLGRMLSFFPLLRLLNPSRYGSIDELLYDLKNTIYCQVYKHLGMDLPWRTDRNWPQARG